MTTPTRVTLIAGFLGAGKTSVIQHLLRQEDDLSQTAVLVNEIGDVGIDGDLIASTSRNDTGCAIREMAGGCICCNANVAFRQAIVEFLRKKPQRLIVEPTGVAAVGTVRDVFADPGIAPYVHVDPLLVVMDPRHWDEPRIREHPLYQEQCNKADAIAITHADLCDADLLQRFKAAHADIPMTIADHGVLSTAISDFDHSETPRSTEKVTSKGIRKHIVTWPSEHVVSLDEITALWQNNPPPATVLRCKAIVKTDTSGPAWTALQINGTNFETNPTPPSEQSRLVVILLDEPAANDWWNTVHPQLAP